MSSVTFKLDTKDTARVATAALLLTGLVAAGLLAVFVISHRSSSAPATDPFATDRSWSSIDTQEQSEAWTAFFRRKAAGEAGNVSENYRLAGTFFEFGASSATRRAILDDIRAGRQHIVSEGQSLSDLLILSIASDHILVRAPSGAEEQLWLSFRSAGTNEVGTGGTDGSDSALASTDEFGGSRVGPNRWVFQREKLMSYYTDLMSDPERLVRVFDSLKPMWTEDGGIEGYELEVFGEKQFFDSVGLKAGDRVRSVNSIEMTNRRRAEYLISEFVKDRVNVVVIDIERDGKAEKFIYQIR